MKTEYLQLAGLEPTSLLVEGKRTIVLVCLAVHGKPSLRTATTNNNAVSSLEEAEVTYTEVADYLEKNGQIIKARIALGVYELDEAPDLESWVQLESAGFMAETCGVPIEVALDTMCKSPIHYKLDETKQNWEDN